VLSTGRQLAIDQVPRRSLPGGVELPVFTTPVPCDPRQCGVAGRAGSAPGATFSARGQPRLNIEEPRVTRFCIRAISAEPLGPSIAACLRAGFRFDSVLASSQPSSSPGVPSRERLCSLVGDEAATSGFRTRAR